MSKADDRTPGERMADRCKCIALNEVVFTLPDADLDDVEIRVAGAASEVEGRRRLEALMRFLVEGELP